MKALFISVSLIAPLMFGSIAAFAASGAGVTYHGRLVDPAGNPVVGTSVQFRLQIRTPGNENCLMYEEIQSKDMSTSNGVFALTINDGSGARQDGSGFSLDQIFANRSNFTFPGGYCASGTSYLPNSSDGRSLQVYFNDGTFSGWEPVPSQGINFIPMAIESMQVGGYKKENLVKVASGVDTTGFDLTGANFTELMALLNGTSTQFVKPGAATFTAAPQWAGAPAAGNDLVNKTYVDAQVAAGLPNFGTAGTYTKVTTDAKGRVSSGTTLSAADIPALDAAKITTGVLPIANGGTNSSAALVGSKVMVSSGTAIVEGMASNTAKSNNTFVMRDGSGNIAGALGTYDSLSVLLGGTLTLNGATSGSVAIASPTAPTSYTLTLPTTGGTNGYVLSTNGSGVTSWVAMSSGSVTAVSSANADISVATGSSTPVLTLNSGTTGGAGDANKIAKLDAGGLIPTAMLPGLNTSQLTAGTLPIIRGGTNSATALTNNQLMFSNAGAIQELGAMTDGQIVVGKNASAPQIVSVSGDVSITNAGATTVAKINGTTVSGVGLANNNLLQNNSGSSISANNVLVSNGAGTGVAALTSPASGVLTSSANVPSWSSSLAATMGGTGQTTFTQGDLLYASSTTALSRLPAATAGYVLTSNGAGTNPSWTAPVSTSALSAITAASATNTIDSLNFAQNWNWSTATTQSPMTITANALTTGSLLNLTTSSASINSTNGLLNVANSTATTTGTLARFQSNSTAGSGMTILNSGNVGVGTTNPGAPLDVKGAIRLSGATSGYAGFQPAAAAGSTVWTLPATDSTGTQYLKSDGAGTLSWGTPGGGGTVTAVSSANADISVATGSSTPVLTLNSGATGGAGDANKIAKLDAGGLIPTAMLPGLNTSQLTAGTLPIIRGGTNSATALTNNQLMFSNAGAIQELGAMTDGQIVVGKNASAPQIVSVSGDVSITNAGATTVAKINGTTVSGVGLANNNLLQNNSGSAITANNMLISNGTATGVTALTSPASGVLTSSANVPSWSSSLAATMGGTGQTTFTQGDLLYASSTTALSRLPAATAGYVLTSNGAGTNPSWTAPVSTSALSAITAASATNTIDSLNFAQNWNWSTATTQSPMTITANALTTGSLLNLTTSSASINSTNGLLNVANSTATTTGTLARFQSNSTAGSGMTILNSGNVGVGTTNPGAPLDVKGAIRLSGATSGYAGFQPAAAAGSTVWTLPATDSTGTQYLKSDGAGTLSWGTPGGGGTVTAVSSANADISVATGSSTPVLTLNSGTTGGAGDANKIAKLDAGGLIPTAMLPGLNTSQLTAGTLPIIRGGTNSATALTNNQLMFSNAGAIQELGAMTDGQIVVGKNASAPQIVSVSGDVSITNAGATTVAKINGTTVSGVGLANNNLLQNNSGSAITANNMLISNGTATGVTALTSPASGVLTSSANVPSWSSSLAATMGGTGQTTFTQGDLLYASSTTALSRLPAATAGYVLTSNGAGTNPSWTAPVSTSALSAITAASATNTIDSLNFAQNWNWSTATTQSPMTITANALTTGSLLNLTTSSASINSTNGLLNVANSTATTTGTLARFQANSTAGSGMTILNSGDVGVGTTSPSANLHIQRSTTPAKLIVESTLNDWTGSASLVLLKTKSTANAFVDYAGPTSDWNTGNFGGLDNFIIHDGWWGQDVISIEPNATANRLYFKAGGNVGIGTTTPRTTLDVNGAIVSKASTLNAGATIDYIAGNIQHTTSDCGAFNLWNLKDGGSYMFVVKGTTSATCSFTAYSDGGTTPLTVHLPPDHSSTTSGKHTIYNLAVSGGDVYLAWTPGY